ncbi:MAG TPA: hypothetical protein VMK84_04210 [Streptosporangiaceae bacterium]|nr:hypothetical protein [Streptosporangiaceae bacterium]
MAAEANFRRLLAELGATPDWTTWLGAREPHQVICKNGHKCSPAPTSVQQGKGACHICAGKEWDVFYIVTSRSLGQVKFGITSGDPRSRLADHRRAGYRQTAFVATGIDAKRIEDEVQAALAKHGHLPIHGREHFAIGTLSLILRVANEMISDASLQLPREMAAAC